MQIRRWIHWRNTLTAVLLIVALSIWYFALNQQADYVSRVEAAMAPDRVAAVQSQQDACFERVRENWPSSAGAADLCWSLTLSGRSEWYLNSEKDKLARHYWLWLPMILIMTFGFWRAFPGIQTSILDARNRGARDD